MSGPKAVVRVGFRIKSGAGGGGRTHTSLSAQRFLRPSRLPFRHSGNQGYEPRSDEVSVLRAQRLRFSVIVFDASSGSTAAMPSGANGDDRLEQSSAPGSFRSMSPATPFEAVTTRPPTGKVLHATIAVSGGQHDPRADQSKVVSRPR